MSDINGIIKIVEILSQLVLSLGIVRITILVILIYGIFLVNKILKDKNDRSYYDSMLKEKNKNIEQLADDNRRYRDIYLKQIKGVDPELYKQMSAETVTMEDRLIW